MSGHSAEEDAGQCGGSIPVEHTLGALPDHCPTCAEYDGPRRRAEAEARRCSQGGCPGDGRYQPPGKGHVPDCQHNAVAWVWETVTPPTESAAPTCECYWTDPSTWLSGYGSGYEPGSQMEWNPDCPAHPPAKPICNCSASNPFKAHGADPAHCPVHGEPTRVLPPGVTS